MLSFGVEGRRRFRILMSWDQDGYRVAQVEWVQDIHPPEGSQERADLQQMATGAAELARAWIRSAREAARIGRRSRQMELLQADGMPSPQDPERFSFWLVNLLNLRPSERSLRMLSLVLGSKIIDASVAMKMREERLAERREDRKKMKEMMLSFTSHVGIPPHRVSSFEPFDDDDDDASTCIDDDRAPSSH